MQLLNLTKFCLFFNIVSPVVHTLLPLVLQRLNSCGIETLILILKNVLNCRYDLIIGPILLPLQEHDPGETILPSSVFQAVHEMSLVLLFFQSSELLIQCEFIWKEMHLVSGKIEFSACQVSLLWHNFFVNL